MDIIQLNKLSQLHDGKNIIFCKTDYVLRDLEYIGQLSTDAILITCNSDYAITDDVVAYAPKNLKKWFCANKMSDNPLLVSLPIGIENTTECAREGHGYVWDHAHPKIQLISSLDTSQKPTRKIYANFSVDTHPSRREVAEICKHLSYVTTDLSDTHTTINQRSYTNYAANILDHEMMVCPRGNGIDCHRVWEVLYMGRIPIIKKEKAMDAFKDLPIIMLDNWDELKDLGLLQNKLAQVKCNSRELLNFEYWKTLILGYTNYEN